jgi:hypothetical protein
VTTSLCLGWFTIRCLVFTLLHPFHLHSFPLLRYYIFCAFLFNIPINSPLSLLFSYSVCITYMSFFFPVSLIFYCSFSFLPSSHFVFSQLILLFSDALSTSIAVIYHVFVCFHFLSCLFFFSFPDCPAFPFLFCITDFLLQLSFPFLIHSFSVHFFPLYYS